MQGNGGRFSKFQIRLRRMRLFRKKKKVMTLDNEKFVQEKVCEIRDVIRNGPTSVGISKRVRVGATGEQNGRLLDGSKSEMVDSSEVVFASKKEMIPTDEFMGEIMAESTSKECSSLKNNDCYQKEKGDIQERIGGNGKPVEVLESSRACSYEKRFVGQKDTDRVLSDVERKGYLKEIGSDILSRLRSQFENYLDQIDVLRGELYLLDQRQNQELELKKIVDLRKRIGDMIQKINVIIDQYNLYNRNYYIDSVVGLEDKELMEDIIIYRDLLNISSEKEFVLEWKALEEFQLLYRELKEIREGTVSVLEKNEDKILEYGIRDQKYAQVQLELVQVDSVFRECSDEIGRQNAYFNDLMSKVSRVDQQQYSTYHLRGMGELLSGSFRYMGYLLLSPFSGFLPHIAIRTLATKEMVRQAYQQLHTEEVRHIRYEAIDYGNEISRKITDIDYTSSLIDHTLGDISKLREDFMTQYNGKIPGYEEVLKRIDDIYVAVAHSQNRVEMIRKNLKKGQLMNDHKLKYVKKMNQE